MEVASAYEKDYTEAPSGLSSWICWAPTEDETVMSTTAVTPDSTGTSLPQRPRRADAARNYDKLLAAARDAFTEDGAGASLEDIARRAGVGIGTLYRNFSTRQALLEAVYIDEVEAICRAAEDLDGVEPWDALVTWLRSFADYATTKKALSAELMAYLDGDAQVFLSCRQSIVAAGAPLLEAAQRAGSVRPDAVLIDVVRMVGGIATIPNAESGQVDRILAVALDGLRPR
jgi:AcrR family transcriptional regulator